MDEQLSFFAAASAAPQLSDLEGLLAGPGRLVRRPDAARISVLVAQDWRSDALLALLADRGLAGERSATEDGHAVVRTSFSADLLPLAERWTRGSMQTPPPGWTLDGPRLHCWAVVAGRSDEHGYLLSLATDREPFGTAVGASLHGAGVPGTLLGPRAGGPAYRITGQRRLRLLRELLGPPPAGAGPLDWPR